MKVTVVVPVCDPGPAWVLWLEAYFSQRPLPNRLIVLDSSTDPEPAQLARARGAEVIGVRSGAFDHGATRQVGLDAAQGSQTVVMMTHDAILASPESIWRLTCILADDSSVGAVVGRQLPHASANHFAIHLRAFNYPAVGSRRTAEDIPRLGPRASFLSDSFTAYRSSAVQQVGGFPSPIVSGEDMLVGARLLDGGWTLVYEPQACVFHSHSYTVGQEARRYFDTGAMHASSPWFRRRFGSASGEGARYVMSELRYIGRVAPLMIPEAIVRSGAKFLSYRLGMMSPRLPAALCYRLGMNRAYWRKRL